jgi:enoyl-CoA hydratase
MGYRYIKYEPKKVAQVILNRPERHNALTYIVSEELDDAFTRAEADEKIRVIVLSGEGRNFCAGHDLGSPEFIAECEERGFTQDPVNHYKNERHYRLDLNFRHRNIRKPTIAMVQGYAIYGGYMLASAMDLIFASEDALFLPPLGQWGATPWDVGPRKAKELIFEHRLLPASEAKECGFVSRVIPGNRLEKETLAFANRVADYNQQTEICEAKMMINHMMDTMGYTSELQSAFINYILRTQISYDERQKRKESGKGVAQIELASENLKLKYESERG